MGPLLLLQNQAFEREGGNFLWKRSEALYFCRWPQTLNPNQTADLAPGPRTLTLLTRRP